MTVATGETGPYWDMDAMLKLRRDTIERCARVAESFHAYDRPAKDIASAIRALKDEK